MSSEPVSSGDTWELACGESLAAMHPDTFHLPSTREGVGAGDYVKLIFANLDAPGERMWVVVSDELEDGSLVGALDSYPHFTYLDHGDAIRFERRHIVDVIFEHDAAMPTEEAGF